MPANYLLWDCRCCGHLLAARRASNAPDLRIYEVAESKAPKLLLELGRRHAPSRKRRLVLCGPGECPPSSAMPKRLNGPVVRRP